LLIVNNGRHSDVTIYLKQRGRWRC